MAQMRTTYDDLEKRAIAIEEYNTSECDNAEVNKRRPILKKVPRVNADNVRINPYLPYTVTDCDAVNYADHVRGILTAKFTNARFARYASSTVQVLLAAGAGVAAAFSGGTSVIAGLAFGSAVTPQLGGIFNAKARAESYLACKSDIDDTLYVYFETSEGKPYDTKLTREGRTLIASVYKATEKAQTALSGDLRGLKSDEETSAGRKKVAAELAALKKENRMLKNALDEKDESVSPLTTSH